MAKSATPTKWIILLAVVGLLVIGYGLTIGSARETAAQQPAGDPVRGGQMYDKWWVVLGVDVPEGNQPLWATQSSNTRSGADTWRCKECHGWDYQGAEGAYGSGSHLTGFPGIFRSRTKSFDELMAAMQGRTNPKHDFSTVMAEQDLVDLVTFISQTLIDADALLADDNTSTGNAGRGQAWYGKDCTSCHGPNGNAINFGSLAEPEFVGHIATDNPWEFIHKVRFGQPGWPMPSAITSGWSDQNVADVLAHAETLATEPALSGGGQLYDKWWDVLGVKAPEGSQPLWATQSTNTRSGADTWRCKECHGWDYRGVEGAYGSGSHRTGFTGVLGASSMSREDLLARLNGQANPDHNFSTAMEEVALNALVTFLQKETTDITPYVNSNSMVSGNPRNGRDLFAGTCAACHGVDGKTLNFGNAEEPEFIGTLAADNPWEFFHKVSFGQPGQPMPSSRALGWTEQDIADLLAYAQTLPVE